MGQYQQWLHFHEVGRHLQAQREELVRELAQLQERSHFYEQILQPQQPSENASTGEIVHAPPMDNVILHALAISVNGYMSSNSHTLQQRTTPVPTSRSEIIPNEQGTTSISPALFAQGNLPNFETPATPPVPVDISMIDTSQFPTYPDQPPPSVPHYDYDMALLPEDMATFFDQYSTTDPQIELPWWLRNLTNVSNNGPIDQESIRTNRLVQRWLERWGKQPLQSPQSQNSGENQS